MTGQEAIAALESVKHEHYDGGYEGLTACPAYGMTLSGVIYDTGKPCECGATEANAKIDAVIAWLREMDEPREGPAARAIRAEIEAWARPAVVTNAEALEQYVRGLRRALELTEQAEARCHDRPPGR